jgi:type I restriction enzyme R subunit
VVSKLLTGFDAPKNTVLYLADRSRPQPIAGHRRVNRLSGGKDFRFIMDTTACCNGSAKRWTFTARYRIEEEERPGQ